MRSNSLETLVSYCDADLLGIKKTIYVVRVVQLFGLIVTCASRKQYTVVISTTEAVYVVFITVITECVWMRGLHVEI